MALFTMKLNTNDENIIELHKEIKQLIEENKDNKKLQKHSTLIMFGLNMASNVEDMKTIRDTIKDIIR